jgi:hypothetical protein
VDSSGIAEAIIPQDQEGREDLHRPNTATTTYAK